MAAETSTQSREAKCILGHMFKVKNAAREYSLIKAKEFSMMEISITMFSTVWAHSIIQDITLGWIRRFS
jgi:hypothetical protein